MITSSPDKMQIRTPARNPAGRRLRADPVVTGHTEVGGVGCGCWRRVLSWKRTVHDGNEGAPSDLLSIDWVPFELSCASFRDEPIDILPAELTARWQTVLDTSDAGETELACELQRDYYAAMAEWAGPWGEAGILGLSLAGVQQVDGLRSTALFDLVSAIEWTLFYLDCSDEPPREAPYPYTLRTNRVRYEGVSGDIFADEGRGWMALTFDQYEMSAGDLYENIVLDGVAVLPRCERTVE